jgi:hypothetical protein
MDMPDADAGVDRLIEDRGAERLVGDIKTGGHDELL